MDEHWLGIFVEVSGDKGGRQARGHIVCNAESSNAMESIDF